MGVRGALPLLIRSWTGDFKPLRLDLRVELDSREAVSLLMVGLAGFLEKSFMVQERRATASQPADARLLGICEGGEGWCGDSSLQLWVLLEPSPSIFWVRCGRQSMALREAVGGWHWVRESDVAGPTGLGASSCCATVRRLDCTIVPTESSVHQDESGCVEVPLPNNGLRA